MATGDQSRVPGPLAAGVLGARGLEPVTVVGDTVKCGGGDEREGGVHLGSGDAARRRLSGLFCGLGQEQSGRVVVLRSGIGPPVALLSVRGHIALAYPVNHACLVTGEPGPAGATGGARGAG